MAKPAIKILFKRMILLGFILVMGSLYFQSYAITFGVVAGVIIAILNLWLIQRAVGGLLAGQRSKLTGLYGVKILAFLVLLFVLIRIVGLHPLGIFAGFSVLVAVAVTSGSVMSQYADDEAPSVEGDR